MTAAQKGLERWHVVMAKGNRPADLAAIIREDAVFHSPVVHTPQKGRDLVVAYLAAAGQTLRNDSFSMSANWWTNTTPASNSRPKWTVSTSTVSTSSASTRKG